MKKGPMILVVVFAIVLSVVLAKNTIAKTIVENGVRVVTGLGLKIEKLDINLGGTFIEVDGFNLLNPKGFEDPHMVNMPEFYVDYDLPAILSGNVHLNEIRIHLEELVVVRNQNGELNLDALKPVSDQKDAPAEKKEKPAKAEGGEAPQVAIDSLQLKIGRVIYKDYSSGKAKVKEFNINISEKFENITDPEALVKIIVVKALMGTPIAALTSFDLGGLKDGVSDTLASSMKVADEFKGKAEDMLKEQMGDIKKMADAEPFKAQAKEIGKLADKGGESVKEAASNLTDKAKGLTSNLKGAVKMPFGNKK